MTEPWMRTPQRRHRGMTDAWSATLLAAAVATIASACSKPAPPQPTATPAPVAAVPVKAPPRPLTPADRDPRSADGRRSDQEATLASFQVFHDLRFSDGLAASGITFAGAIVDDAGRDYKLVHYDHGCGMAAGDVDGDGLTDLYFLTQVGQNQLWRNRGGGRFEDWTKKSGLALEDAISVSAAFADYDNDGDDDLFVTTVRHGNHLFRNASKGKFEDVSKGAGVDYVGHSSGASFVDYDRDGLLDLVVANIGRYTSDELGRHGYYVGRRDAFSGHLNEELTETSLLYRNLGKGKFEDVSARVGFVDTGWSGDVAVHDINGDGFPDLYLTNMQGDDHLWENQGGQSFVEKTATYFPKTSWGAMSARFLDWNNDGNLDLFTTDMHSDMFFAVDLQAEKAKTPVPFDLPALKDGSNNLFGNSFYQGKGNGQFEEVSDRINVETYWPWGVSTGDLNGDGFEDLFITASMNYPWRYHYNSLLLNNRGERYLDAEFIVGVEPRSGGRTETAWFTLDCSGGDQAHAECKNKTGTVTVMGALGSRGSLLVDLDADGDLDIVTNEFNSAPQVLLSDLAAKTAVHFLKIELRGTTSNRDGLGARVTVHAGPARYTKLLDGGLGYLTHGVVPLYFGLGDAITADRIDIEWPSGRKQSVSEGIPTNGLLTVTEPGA